MDEREFNLTIDATFSDDEIGAGRISVAMRLREIAASLEMGTLRPEGKILHANGHTLGKYTYEVD